MAVYESDPDAAPDDAFEPGSLAHIVAGNRGRLLDARRTPVVVRGVSVERGTFEVEVAAFEDARAVWEIEAERADRFQFHPGQPTADVGTVAALEGAIARFDLPLSIAAAETDRAATDERIAADRERARTFLPGSLPPMRSGASWKSSAWRSWTRRSRAVTSRTRAPASSSKVTR